LAYARLEDATVPVHVIATGVEGMAVVLSKGPAIDAILASTAIPGVFPPVRIDGQTLIDGAIAWDTPNRVAADLGASRIVVLPTGYACALDEPPKGAITWALHAITLLIAWRLIHDLEQTECTFEGDRKDLSAPQAGPRFPDVAQRGKLRRADACFLVPCLGKNPVDNAAT
jgi:predicted acylesterase/phospholipase RssA